MKFTPIILVLLINLQFFSQETPDNNDIIIMPKETKVPEDAVYEVPEQRSEFPGGMAQMMAYLSKETKNSSIIIEENIKGKVYLTFIIEKDGTLSNIAKANFPGKVQNQILVDEAIKIVSKMPKWDPAKERGKVVRSKFIIPVNFN